MQIIIKKKNCRLTKEIEDYAVEKIGGISRIGQIFKKDAKKGGRVPKKGKDLIEVFVEAGKENLHHKKGPVFMVEAQIFLPGRKIMARTKAEDIKVAINELKEEIERELKQYTKKKIAVSRRSQREVKKEFHLAPGARFYRKGRIREEGL